MRSIGFKNFRRFKDFPEINLGDITILVGANNSGKSTLIQSILLCEMNIKQIKKPNLNAKESDYSFIKCPTFKFDCSIWNDLRIKTFQRAFCKIKAKRIPSNVSSSNEEDNIITFTFSIGYFKFSVIVKGNKQQSNEIECEIIYISIEDYLSNYILEEIYPSHQRRLIVLNEDNIEAENIRNEFWNNKYFSHCVGDYRIANYLRNGFYNSTIKQIYNLNYEEYQSSENHLIVFLWDNLLEFARNLNFKRDNLRSSKTDYTDYKGFCFLKAPNIISDEENEISRSFLNSQIEKIYSIKERLKTLASNNLTNYFKIHIIEQHFFLDATNRNDYVANTINDYYNSKIKNNNVECRFIKKWLKKFDIADNFRIKCLGGESFCVELIKDNSFSVNLADMGIGAIQIFTLLIRIAYIMRIHNIPIRINLKGKDLEGRKLGFKEESLMEDFSPVIVIEEPEQNLHPKTQSLLADLFFEMNQKYGFKIIVETHSEYLIRKSQVLVKDFASKNNIKTKEDLDIINPFKVYYFDSKSDVEPYYEMKYGTNGLFDRKFGEGFIDISSKLLMDLL